MKQIIKRSIICSLCVISAITLKAAEIEIDSLKNDNEVQVAFRKVAKNDLMGSISTINLSDLNDINHSRSTLDNLQGYVGGFNGTSIWGYNNYLVLVDGIPRSADTIMPEEIEDISILKGASAVVLYGSQAANGIVYITTKRGRITDGLNIDARFNMSNSFAKSYPEYLGSAEYMTYYNQARINDGLTALYSDEEIANYASGSNPYRYPDVDFYSSDYIRNYYNTYGVSTDISGGSETATFFTNLGYTKEDGFFTFGEAAKNSTDRFNMRGNVDIKISDKIKAYANSNVTFWSKRQANSTLWSDAGTLRPNEVSPLIPISMVDPNNEDAWTLINNTLNLIDGEYILGGDSNNLTNIFADIYASGYKTVFKRNFQFDAGTDIDLSSVLDGLSFQAQYAVDYTTGYTTSYANEYAVFKATWSDEDENLITGLTQEGLDEKSGTQSVSDSSAITMQAMSAQLNYNKTFNKLHNVSAMAIVNGYTQTTTEVYQSDLNANAAFQASYNFDHKYYADFSGGFNYSTKLHPDNRVAFSPSVTLGWSIGEEQFLKGTSFDNLILSFSASKIHTDIDISDYYLYAEVYNIEDSTSARWYDNSFAHGTNSLTGGNPDLGFITHEEISVNLRGSLWDQTFVFDASAYISEENGLLSQVTSLYPSYFTNDNYSFIPYENYECNKRMGVEFNAMYNKQIGEVGLSLGVAATYNVNEATKRNENYENDYQNRTGKYLNSIWGLESDGFFESDEDIASSPFQSWSTVKPGDIKYVDQNGDDVIDSEDVVLLAKNSTYGAPLTVGANLTLRYKNFTLFALATGNFLGYSTKSSSYWWIDENDKYSAVVRDSWTAETKDTATYPRLSSISNTNNNRTSDFWLYSTNRIDLSRVQLTYDLPQKLFANSWIKGLSVYANGSNLLTIAKEREILEMSVASAPQVRTIKLGVNASF
ncbi:MAG: SusC/RagA family TonB-linked outer membrane protein [Rikenellaceae bacterium]